MTAISPYVRLENATIADLSTNRPALIAETFNVPVWKLGWHLDGTDTLSFGVTLGEAGNPTLNDPLRGQSFSTSLIAATGGPGSSGIAVPTIAEFSLDGAVSFDCKKLVERPTRVTSRTQPMVIEDGASFFVMQSTVGVDRATYDYCALIDVLGALAGTIVPLANSGFGIIAPSSAGAPSIPYLQGILQVLPGQPSWPLSNRKYLQYTPVLDPIVAFLATSVDINSDYVVKVLQMACDYLGGQIIFTSTGAMDSALLSSRGHYVVDTSEASLNLSRWIPGVVGGKGATAANPGISSSGLNGVGQTVVIGNVGGAPVPNFTFIGTNQGSGPAGTINDTIEAFVETDGLAVVQDLSDLWGQATFIGGASNAGIPPGTKFTKVVSINNGPTGPTDTRDQWNASLPLVGVNVQDKSGGVYFWVGDGQLHPIPNSPIVAVYDIHIDNVTSTIYIATATGVYSHPVSNLFTGGWQVVGGLSARIVRVEIIQYVSSPPKIGTVFALAQGNGPKTDGVYRLSRASVPGDYTPTGVGYDSWTRLYVSPNVYDFVPTDDHTIFVIDRAVPSVIFKFDPLSSSTPVTQLPLPTGVKAHRLDRVIGAGTGTANNFDSIWVCTSGDDYGVYVTYNNAGTWTQLAPGNADNSLVSNLGRPLQVNSISNIAQSINGTMVDCFACTNNGLYYLEASPNPAPKTSGWKPANGQNGLDGYPIFYAVSGGYVNMLGRPVSRIYAINDTQFFHSDSSAVWWTDVAREKLDLGPYFYALALDATNPPPIPTGAGGHVRYPGMLDPYASRSYNSDLGEANYPSNSIQTIGPMADSPLNSTFTLAGQIVKTHLQVAGCLPSGWYWQRVLNGRMNWSYILVNGTAPNANRMFHQATQIETSESVNVTSASLNLASVVIKWLAESSVVQTVLNAKSSMSRTESTLRVLRPTMRVYLTFQGVVNMQAQDGTIWGTTYVNYVNEPFYILDHEIEGTGTEGSLARSTTILGKVLRTKLSTPDEVASSLQDQIKNLRVFGKR